MKVLCPLACLLKQPWLLQDWAQRAQSSSGFVQAMDLISVAQRTGQVSADAYSDAYHEANGVLPPPEMAGIEEMVEQMHVRDAESNPFASGGNSGSPDTAHKPVDGAYSGAPSPGPGGQFRPPAIVPPAPSPPRSVVSLFTFPSNGTLHNTPG